MEGNKTPFLSKTWFVAFVGILASAAHANGYTLDDEMQQGMVAVGLFIATMFTRYIAKDKINGK